MRVTSRLVSAATSTVVVSMSQVRSMPGGSSPSSASLVQNTCCACRVCSLRFYTMVHHTNLTPGAVITIHDPRETAERLEREEAARTANA